MRPASSDPNIPTRVSEISRIASTIARGTCRWSKARRLHDNLSNALRDCQQE